MSNFFAELKRRHIYRVAAAYAVVAWIVLQIVNNIAPAFNLPGPTVMLVIVLLSAGFPIALIFAWVLELKASDAPTKTGAVDWLLVAVAIAFIGMFAYQQLLLSHAMVTAQPGVEAAREASAKPAGISVAVLPFTDLSQNSDQGFFSDGVTEEIITALSKIPDLRVVARESAFQYKGEKTDMRTVGRALNATHIIGGSVRKAGTRVRIAAQLVKADDGVNIWADAYDRELTDIFAIQEDIARAIATSLRMPLGLKSGESLVSNRPKDEQTYELYLRGVNALRQQGPRQGLDLLEQVVARDPNFAPGWVQLAVAQRRISTIYGRTGEQSKVQQVIDAAEAAARRAIELAPDYAGGYGSLAASKARRGKWAEAADLFKQSLARDPDDPEVLHAYGLMLRIFGYLKDSLDVREHLSLLEPLVPLYNGERAEVLLANRKTEPGQNELRRLVSQYGVIATLSLAASYAEQERFPDAAGLLDSILSPPSSSNLVGVFARPLVEAAAQVLHAAANKTDAPAKLPDFNSDLNFVYLYTGTPGRMFDWFEKDMAGGNIFAMKNIWWPTPSALRKTERFKALVRKAGLVDYWRARGWPDRCHPTAGDDFECD